MRYVNNKFTASGAKWNFGAGRALFGAGMATIGGETMPSLECGSMRLKLKIEIAITTTEIQRMVCVRAMK